jgi:hypothetical protein
MGILDFSDASAVTIARGRLRVRDVTDCALFSFEKSFVDTPLVTGSKNTNRSTPITAAAINPATTPANPNMSNRLHEGRLGKFMLVDVIGVS